MTVSVSTMLSAIFSVVMFRVVIIGVMYQSTHESRNSLNTQIQKLEWKDLKKSLNSKCLTRTNNKTWYYSIFKHILWVKKSYLYV